MRRLEIVAIALVCASVVASPVVVGGRVYGGPGYAVGSGAPAGHVLRAFGVD